MFSLLPCVVERTDAPPPQRSACAVARTAALILVKPSGPSGGKTPGLEGTVHIMAGKDSIVRQIRGLLEHESRIRLHHYPIKIHMADDAVVLEGDVESVAAKKLALELAGGVNGIRGLVDRLRVVPTERRGDGAVRDLLCGFLLQAPELRNCTIHARVKGRVEILREVQGEGSGQIEVLVEDGVITLEGSLISLSHKRIAGVLAWWTPGCRDVVNSLDVLPVEEDNDAEVLDALHLVLEMDPLLRAEQIRAQARNYVVTLEGFVRSEEERRRAELDAWALFAVDNVVNKIEVRP
jgi:osmotically-inducible protein OsmY